MWTEAALTNLIPYAHTALECIGRRHPARIISGAQTIDTDMPRELWSSLTDGARAYFVLFWCAYYRKDWVALSYICSPAQYRSMVSNMTSRLAVARYELTRVDARLDQLIAERLRRRHARDQVDHPQRRGWTREDIAAEFYDESGEPRLGPPKVPLEPRLAEYADSPAPVKRIDPKEYLATRRPPKYGGVKLEFEKESEHWTKEISETADKIYDGTTPDEF